MVFLCDLCVRLCGLCVKFFIGRCTSVPEDRNVILIRRFVFPVCYLLLLVATSSSVGAQQFNPNLFQEMKWRMIGPFRGGRTVGAIGVPGQPNVYYIGVNNRGACKTTDYAGTWWPIFDDQPTG